MEIVNLKFYEDIMVYKYYGILMEINLSKKKISKSIIKQVFLRFTYNN